MRPKQFVLLPLLLAVGIAGISLVRPDQTPEQPYRIWPVEFLNGELRLAGDFLIPEDAEPPVPAVVLIHGSGTADRTQGWVRMFADHLAKNGIAVLIPDKRGSGESGGDWRTAGFEELAEDAIAAVRFVREQSWVQPGRIGVAGFSQGGRIAPLAASRSGEIEFVINVSGGAVPMEETMIHEVTRNAISEGLNARQITEMLQLHGAFFDYVMNGDWSDVQRLRELALNSDWSEFARSLPLDRDLWIWDWLKKVAQTDPLPYWEKVEVPVLVAYGENDEQDKVMVWQSVYRLSRAFSESGHRDYLIRVYPETEHGLFEPRTMHLHREFSRLLVDWIKGGG